MPICQVCQEAESKYKCPKCVIPYCSLSCFKQHKPENYSCSIQKSETDKQTKDCKENAKIDYIPTQESVKLSKDQLLKLAKNPVLRKRLEDQHLQKYLKALNQSEDPDEIFEQLQNNERFNEFCDLVMTITSN